MAAVLQERQQAMRKVTKPQLVKAIVKIYFVGALAGSFAHAITAAHKAGLAGWEAWSVPFMIDGLALIGLVMRGADFSAATRRTGLRVQAVMGLVSMAANVYAAHNLGGAIFGASLVGLWLASEHLAANLEPAAADAARDQAAKRSAAATKAAATRKANAAAKAQPKRKLAAV
jgi:hypothetical protein